ncbi:hypothetical protein [Pseudaestuariivita rosea]|uniref:hypothetical protein n=1 Tax=Pseudaestuariivita rosea TaxID=2763263 RepID=UPI001ABA05CD|nr:hypothetical protein [Pseudaestuariivita rosea]
MSRVLGYCLTTGDFEGWTAFAALAMARLTVEERAALAWAALQSLDTPEQAELVTEAVLTPAGDPLPTFLNPMQDARWWAEMATNTERKAYALAAYEALPFADQMAFRRHITEIEIAA